jgi:uncharacterized protein YggT (Ycf19 family)
MDPREVSYWANVAQIVIAVGSILLAINRIASWLPSALSLSCPARFLRKVTLPCTGVFKKNARG